MSESKSVRWTSPYCANQLTCIFPALLVPVATAVAEPVLPTIVVGADAGVADTVVPALPPVEVALAALATFPILLQSPSMLCTAEKSLTSAVEA